MNEERKRNNQIALHWIDPWFNIAFSAAESYSKDENVWSREIMHSNSEAMLEAMSSIDHQILYFKIDARDKPMSIAVVKLLFELDKHGLPAT